MGSVTHAEYELKKAGLFDEDSDYGGMLGKAALDIVKVFAEQGHSGGSAGIVRSVLHKLFAQEPLTPLTGDDDEWNDISEMSDNPCFQNKRCSRVFKDKKGNAYDVDGKVFVHPNGASYTSSESKTDVTFPYLPHTEYIDVPEDTE